MQKPVPRIYFTLHLWSFLKEQITPTGISLAHYETLNIRSKNAFLAADVIFEPSQTDAVSRAENDVFREHRALPIRGLKN